MNLKNVEYVDVVPVFVVVLGSDAKKLGQWIGKLGIKIRIALLQRTTLLKTARILGKVLDF